MKIFMLFAATFLLTIFTSSNLVAVAASAEGAAEMEKFHKLIVKPLEDVCAYPDYNDERKLCENVKALGQQIDVILKSMSSSEEYTDRDGMKKGIYEKFHLVINEDASHLHTEYKKLLLLAPNAWELQISQKIEGMNGEDLILSFKSTYLAFERELGESCKEKGSEIECQKVVYELLCIIKQLHALIKVEEWRHALAYKQFAINLAIHSLHIDNPPNSSHGGVIKTRIQQIAKSWMQIEEMENLNDIEQQFYKSFVGPVVHNCDWHFGLEIETDRFAHEVVHKPHKMKAELKLCTTIKALKRLFTKLNEQNQLAKEEKTIKSAREKSGEILQQIHNRVMADLVLLTWDCYATLTKKMTNSVDIEIKGHTIKELNTEFKEAFEQMQAQLKKVLKVGAEQSTSESRKIAYKLLRIGETMDKLLKPHDTVNLKWAFQQFAANLAVYSLRLDHPKHNGEEGDIQKLAGKWTIGMHEATATNDKPSHINNNE